MKWTLPALLLLLGGCYDFGALSANFGKAGDMAGAAPDIIDWIPTGDLSMVDMAKTPAPDLSMADLAGVKPPDLIGMDMTMRPPDLVMTPPDLTMAKPPDLVMNPPDLSVVMPPDMAMVMPPDMAMMMPADMAMTLPPDMAMAIPPDLAVRPDLVVVATCNDGIKNGNETDIDCGGGTCAGCANFKICKVNADCASGYCPAGTCAVAPTCNDGVKNGSESDVDCGGLTCPGCVFGKACLLGTDCASKNCVGGKCALPLYCSDGTKDNDETDVDCGGPTCAKCAAGKGCQINADCATLVCTGGKCGTGIGLKLSFASQVVYKLTANSGPAGIATGDFNVDGVADLVTANDGLSTVAQLAGTGNGGFGAATYTMLPANNMMPVSPEAIVVGDWNKDGKPDWATADVADGTAAIGTNAGNGSFGVSLVSGAGGNSAPYSITAADLNGDGFPDLAMGAFGTASLAVLTNRAGAGWNTLLLNAGAATWWVTTGDLNRDGRVDLLLTKIAGKQVAVALNTGNATFAAPVNYAANTGPYFAVVADWNGDQKPDVAVANSAGFNPGNVSILLGNGDGTLQAPVQYASGNSPISLAVADYNMDGKLDIATSNQNLNSCGVLLGNGDGTFTGGGLSLAVGMKPVSIVTGDFNKDGKPDFATANYLDDSVSVVLNTSM